MEIRNTQSQPKVQALQRREPGRNKRGLYASIFKLRWVVGEIIGPVLGATVMTSVGGSKMFLFLGGVIAVCAIPLLVLVKMIRQTKLTNIGLGGDDIVNS
ncbi:hypothetical protein BXT84_12650 [Sulfobacillus thermotolerans]|uniref:Major facilitator superfamily (MFS) profile domain-containing protein n=1 Tax=Sulfobacillus thermotolerans TaxID=338644 RepID=A0ABN5H1S9_9FIRM|nr:hypothetical protein BXT84_12650 [Sulfobacillus thermotolerans]